MYEVKKNQSPRRYNRGLFCILNFKNVVTLRDAHKKNNYKSDCYTNKKGRNAAFLVIRVIFQADRYAVIPLIYFRDGSVSAVTHPDGCYAWI
ncbi:hypothetical protein DMB08_13620 [Salmonella enterica subsp. salamae]|nr:hypothetical protein [Salmonella enterica subsp. salamae]